MIIFLLVLLIKRNCNHNIIKHTPWKSGGVVLYGRF